MDGWIARPSDPGPRIVSTRYRGKPEEAEVEYVIFVAVLVIWGYLNHRMFDN